MTLTVGSLFSGIGGIDLGLELAGMRVRWQVEIDPWCQRVLEKHWPNVDRYEDVREVGAHNLERVDLIAGGFPCQDISIAGRGVGIGGTRSGLWSEFARIVGELRPRYVLVENVPALLHRGLDVVLGDLAACGYDAEWDCIPAAAVGAPHRRDRFWLVAYPGGSRRREDSREGRATQDDHKLDGDGQGDRARSDGGSEVADPDSSGLERWLLQPERSSELPTGPSGLEDADSSAVKSRRRWRRVAQTSRWWWSVEPPVGRVAHGVPARVDRLRGLGNAVVPQVVEWIGRRIVEAETRHVADAASAGQL